jgi:hypothetical protein
MGVGEVRIDLDGPSSSAIATPNSRSRQSILPRSQQATAMSCPASLFASISLVQAASAS